MNSGFQQGALLLHFSLACREKQTRSNARYENLAFVLGIVQRGFILVSFELNLIKKTRKGASVHTKY